MLFNDVSIDPLGFFFFNHTHAVEQFTTVYFNDHTSIVIHFEDYSTRTDYKCTSKRSNVAVCVGTGSGHHSYSLSSLFLAADF